MAKILHFIDSIEGNSSQYNEFVLNLLINILDSPLAPEEKAVLESLIISKINSYLNKANTKIDGLNIISNIISKCSRDMLTKYGLLWITKATEALKSIENRSNELTIACKVLGNLLVFCKKIPEVQKEISLHNVKQLILIITKMNLNKKGPSILYPLVILLYYYKESTEKFQPLINDFILCAIDSNDEYLVQASANCFSVLARATEKSFKVDLTSLETYWTFNEALICNSLYCIINSLFKNSLDSAIDSSRANIGKCLILSNSIPEDDIFEYYFGLERRFQNLSIYLSTMLRGCGGKNSVLLDDILQLLCRGLAITPIILRKDDFLKNQLLIIIIPKLHIHLLNILNGLIEGISCHLIPVANEILLLYIQTLKWIAKTNDYSEKQTTIKGNKPFINLKISVYKSLSLWLMNLGRNSGIEMVFHQVIPFIFEDITPEKLQISLTVQKNCNLSKTTYHAVNNAAFDNNTVDDPLTNAAAADLCKEALCVLSNIFYNTGLLIKSSFYEKCQKLIVNLLYHTYLEKEKVDFYKNNAECRLNLIKAFRAIMMNSHPQISPSITYAIQLFNFAIKDEQICIKKEARIGLTELEKIVHPSVLDFSFSQSIS